MSDVRIKVSIDGQEANLTLSQITTRVEELKDQASGLDEGTEELKRLTDQIVALQAAADRLSLQVSVDADQATSAIQEVVEAVGSIPDASITVTADAAQAAAEIAQVGAAVPEVEVTVTADPSAVTDALDGLSAAPLVVPVDADVTPAQDAVDSLSAGPVVVPVSADTSEAQDGLSALSAETMVVPVDADVEPAQAALDSLGVEPLVVPVEADSTAARGEISSLEASPISVPVGADVSRAQESVDGIAALPVTVPVDADATQAREELDSIQAAPLLVPVDADVSPAQEQVTSIEVPSVTLPVDADVAPAQADISSLDAQPVTVPVDADVDDAQRSIESLEAEPVSVPVEVDTTELQAELDSAAADAEPVEVPVDTSQAVASITELKEQLRAAKDEIASADFGSQEFIDATQRAGELRDRIQDVQEAVDQQTGEPIERLGSQFRGLGDSILKLDFKKATEQFKTFSQTIGQVDLKGLASGAGGLAKTIGGGVVDAFKTLGRVIIANPILLIAAVVIGIGTALFKLKDSIKPVQVAFDAIGDAIGFVTDLLKSFSDAIGLSNFEETEAIEKANKAYEEKAKVLEDTTKREIAILKAKGATVEEIAAVERAAAEQQVADSQAFLAGNEEELAGLQAQVAATEELSEEQQKRYDLLTKAQDDAIAGEQKLLDLSRQQLQQEQSREQLANRLAVLEAGTAREKLAAQRKEIADNTEIAVQQAVAAGKGEKDIALIRRQGLQAQSALTSAFADQAAQKQKARDAAAEKVQREFLDDERTRLSKSFDDRIRALSDLGIREGAQVDALNAAKLRVLEQFDAERERRERESADRRIALGAELAVKEAEARKREALEDAGPDLEARRAVELSFIQELSDLRVASIEAQSQLELDAVEQETAKKLEAAGLTEDQRTAIAQEGADRRTKIELDADAAVSAERTATEQKRQDELTAGIEREKAEVLRARAELVAKAGQSGILGLSANLGALQKSIDDEKALLKRSRDSNAISEKVYQEKLTEIQENGEDARRDLAATAVQQSAAQAQQLLDTVSSVLATQTESELAEVDRRSEALTQEGDARRAAIEEQAALDAEAARSRGASAEEIAAIETRKQAALDALSSDIASKGAKLERERVELQKRQIKQERNATLAQVALSSAQAIAGALKTGGIAAAGGPIAFALSLAAGLAVAYAAIKKAKDALKAADASVSAAGGGGGGSLPATPSGSVGQGAVPAAQTGQSVPQFTPAGVNAPPGQGGAPGQPPAQPPVVVNATVSVVDINSAQGRVRVSEAGSTISGSV